MRPDNINSSTFLFDMINTSAFSDGCSARIDDDENNTLTDNPHTPGTNAFDCWYRGYNFKEEHLATPVSIASKEVAP